MKKILTFLVTLVMVTSFAVTASAADMPRLVDGAGLLSSSEARELTSKLDKISNETECDITVVTKNSLGGQGVESVAHQVFKENGYGFGTNKDGVILLISMEERDWAITATGFAQTALNEEARETIAGKIVGDLGNEEYAKAFTRYADICKDVITKARDGKTFRSPFPAGRNFVIALVISLVIAFVVTGTMKGELTSVRSQAEAKAYIKQGSIKVTESTDRFLYKRTEKIPKQQNTTGNVKTVSETNHSSTSGKF